MEQDDPLYIDELDLEEDDSQLNPPKENTLTSLSSKSKEVYEVRYNHYLNWFKERDLKRPFSEECILMYFIELSKKTTPSTLWTNYSMLRTTLGFYQNVDISKYVRLRSFLKRKAKGYKPRKTKKLTTDEINKFLQEAPDNKYLLHKVALIVSVYSACRRNQLVELRVDDVEDLGSSVSIKMKDPRSGKQHVFSIAGEHYEFFRRYANLRPPNTTERRFFLNYQNGKCMRQPVGKNKFGMMPKHIATFLGLKEPGSYTGNCFKKSSTTVIVDLSGEISSLRQRLCLEMPVNYLNETSPNNAKGVETTMLVNESSCSSSSYSNRSVPTDNNCGVDALQPPHDNTEVNFTSNGPPMPPVYAENHQSPRKKTINYLADVLPCPPRVNDSAGQQKVYEATEIFTGLCPESLRVKATYPNLGMGKYSCSWRVNYEDADDVQNLPNEQILTALEARRPHYSKIILLTKTTIPLMWSVEYGIMDCRCSGGIVSKPSVNSNFEVIPKSEEMDLNNYDTYE